MCAVPLDDSTFKHATWDWVHDTLKATTTYGNIKDWDVSGVDDFTWVFSLHRDRDNKNLGYSWPYTEERATVLNGNPKAATFTEFGGLASWTTTSLVETTGMFHGAGAMNADLSAWDVTKVTHMRSMFFGATALNGAWLSEWRTSSVSAVCCVLCASRLHVHVRVYMCAAVLRCCDAAMLR